MGAVGAVWAFRKELLFAAPAEQLRAARTSNGLARILDVREAPNALQLLGAAGSGDRNAPGRTTASSRSPAAAAAGCRRRRGRLGPGGALLGLLAHRCFGAVWLIRHPKYTPAILAHTGPKRCLRLSIVETRTFDFFNTMEIFCLS